MSLRSLCVWCWLGSSHFQVNRLWWGRSLLGFVWEYCVWFIFSVIGSHQHSDSMLLLSWSSAGGGKWVHWILWSWSFREQRFSKSDLDNSLFTTEKLTSNKNMKVCPDNISCSVIWFYTCLPFFPYIFFPCKKLQQTKQTKITTKNNNCILSVHCVIWCCVGSEFPHLAARDPRCSQQ